MLEITNTDSVKIVRVSFTRPVDPALIERARELVRRTGSAEMMRAFEASVEEEARRGGSS